MSLSNYFIFDLPFLLKNLFGGILHTAYGEQKHSGKISNLGGVDLPKEIGHYI